MKEQKQSIRERILKLLRIRATQLSAYEIAVKLDEKWGTVSSICYKLVKKKILGRTPNSGPKGGYTYWIP